MDSLWIPPVRIATLREFLTRTDSLLWDIYTLREVGPYADLHEGVGKPQFSRRELSNLQGELGHIQHRLEADFTADLVHISSLQAFIQWQEAMNKAVKTSAPIDPEEETSPPAGSELVEAARLVRSWLSNLRELQGNHGGIFIVHGHDQVSVGRLKDLISALKLTPIVLSLVPGEGRTIIEKFEEEAERVAFAFVLLTPDDVVNSRKGSYSQARPNVVFELGWFYGRLGRQRVCILFKKGTKVHSDLEGISRVEFENSVTTKKVVTELGRELFKAGILSVPEGLSFNEFMRNISADLDNLA